MSSFNSGSHPVSPSFESLLIQNLMGRLHLRPPYLDTNSFLSHSLEDLLLLDDPQDNPLSPAADPDEGPARHGRSQLAREETKLEKEIVRAIRAGGAARDALKPNSGQSVAVGDHNICVGYHEEPGSGYRVWEWHGHLMLFDEEDGFSPEYVYGSYFERVPLTKESSGGGDGGEKVEEKEEEEVEEGKEKRGAQLDLGLRDLIGDEKGCSGGNGGRRVLHRNSLGGGLGR